MKSSKITAALIQVLAVTKTYPDTSVGALDFAKDFIGEDSIDFSDAKATVGTGPLTWLVTMGNGDQLGVHLPGHPEDKQGNIIAIDSDE
ncbi:hypothetical protein [Yersinia ruckeri]|uniref:hypothetical protein n=1 Tax=Yersinia ruckeri TaxID=29486 RepID=UPI00223704A6|nr:hypothetical protein [Yersinia ruckeri]MCW6598867.1 hypothetical protein [Yersinia ruckeri]